MGHIYTEPSNKNSPAVRTLNCFYKLFWVSKLLTTDFEVPKPLQSHDINSFKKFVSFYMYVYVVITFIHIHRERRQRQRDRDSDRETVLVLFLQRTIRHIVFCQPFNAALLDFESGVMKYTILIVTFLKLPFISIILYCTFKISIIFSILIQLFYLLNRLILLLSPSYLFEFQFN